MDAAKTWFLHRPSRRGAYPTTSGRRLHRDGRSAWTCATGPEAVLATARRRQCRGSRRRRCCEHVFTREKRTDATTKDFPRQTRLDRRVRGEGDHGGHSEGREIPRTKVEGVMAARCAASHRGGVPRSSRNRNLGSGTFEPNISKSRSRTTPRPRNVVPQRRSRAKKRLPPPERAYTRSSNKQPQTRCPPAEPESSPRRWRPASEKKGVAYTDDDDAPPRLRPA
ncbi:hypothetical protein MRX96_014507 [Rhipicephalus microplus]